MGSTKRWAGRRQQRRLSCSTRNHAGATLNNVRKPKWALAVDCSDACSTYARVVFETPLSRGQARLRLSYGKGWTLLTAMQEWVGAHRADAAGIDVAMLDSFASWVNERSKIAGQTVGLTREGATSAWK